MMDFEVGQQFVARVAGARQGQLNDFGRMMGTAGRIHTDPEWAAGTPAGGVLVQGGLVMAPLHDVMSRLVGTQRWLRGSRLTIKIVSFTRPNEPITMRVRVSEATADKVGFAVSWIKEDGTTVMVADVETQR